MRDWLAIPPQQYYELDAFGSGAIRCYAVEGPAVFYHNYIQHRREERDRDCLRMGRAFHAAMESEHAWRERYLRIPSVVEDDEYVEAINKIVKSGKPLVIGDKLNMQLKSHQQYMMSHKQRAEREGKDFLSDDEIEQVYWQVSAVYANPACRDLLAEKREFKTEATCVLQHESGVKLKALCDLTLFEKIVDFKTTRFRNKDEFIRYALKNGYDWQAGHYSLVTGKQEFYIVSVTNVAPYVANVFSVPRRTINFRKKEVERQCFDLALKMNDTFSDKDPQGIPLAFHNELWGSVINLELEHWGG